MDQPPSGNEVRVFIDSSVFIKNYFHALKDIPSMLNQYIDIPGINIQWLMHFEFKIQDDFPKELQIL